MRLRRVVRLRLRLRLRPAVMTSHRGPASAKELPSVLEKIVIVFGAAQRPKTAMKNKIIKMK